MFLSSTHFAAYGFVYVPYFFRLWLRWASANQRIV